MTDTDRADIIIREATRADAEAIAELSGQLGYAISPEAMQNNLEMALQSGHSAVYVSLDGSKITGWIYLLKSIDLTSGRFFEIAGLIVDETYRNKSIGKKLVQHAIIACKAEGADKLRVRSQVKRKDAHRFYINLGFVEVKEQKVFDIKLM